MRKENSCLVEDCENNARTTSIVRGLCPKHYQAALSLIREKVTTWKKLEDSGKCLPSRKRGQTEESERIRNWFLGNDEGKIGGMGQGSSEPEKKSYYTPTIHGKSKRGRKPRSENKNIDPKSNRETHLHYCQYKNGFACSCV